MHDLSMRLNSSLSSEDHKKGRNLCGCSLALSELTSKKSLAR